MAKKTAEELGTYELRYGPMPNLYSAFNPFADRAPTEVGDEPSKTRQEFLDECDINGIMARYEKAGGQFPFAERAPMYLDLTVMPSDLMSAMDTMLKADEAFMTLPAHVRKEFDNDTMRFVEFASDAKNLARMKEWGLAAPEKPVQEPIEVRVVPAPELVPGDQPKA